jgi:hypothetical protein
VAPATTATCPSSGFISPSLLGFAKVRMALPHPAR